MNKLRTLIAEGFYWLSLVLILAMLRLAGKDYWKDWEDEM